MTGPEHYREAERLLASSDPAGDSAPASFVALEALHARAQVHATLALAAAAGLNDAESGMPPGDWAAWRDAAGTQPGPGTVEP